MEPIWAPSLGLKVRDTNTSPLQGPFPQEASGPVAVSFTLLQNVKDLQGEGEGKGCGKDHQAGVAALLGHGSAITQWLSQEAPYADKALGLVLKASEENESVWKLSNTTEKAGPC